MTEWNTGIYIGTGIGVLLTTILAGAAGLPLLRRLQVGQTVRQDGPSTHQIKSGTPTFGGLFFAVPMLLSAVLVPLLAPGMSRYPLWIGVALLSGLVGFADDWVKVRVRPKGLSVRAKTGLLLAVQIALIVLLLYGLPEAPAIRLPLSGTVWTVPALLRPLYGLVLLVYLFFFVNAVNLTDGVDGLCVSVTALVAAALAIAAIRIGGAVPDTFSREALMLAVVTAAASLGFLPVNRHRAKVFMGDTGSLLLGTAVVLAAVLLQVPWILLAAGVVYAAEALSVVIQVLYFRKTGGKRIFRMSPIHHHYELGGWTEWKIVFVFSAVTCAGCAAAHLLL